MKPILDRRQRRILANCLLWLFPLLFGLSYFLLTTVGGKMDALFLLFYLIIAWVLNIIMLIFSYRRIVANTGSLIPLLLLCGGCLFVASGFAFYDDWDYRKHIYLECWPGFVYPVLAFTLAAWVRRSTRRWEDLSEEEKIRITLQ